MTDQPTAYEGIEDDEINAVLHFGLSFLTLGLPPAGSAATVNPQDTLINADASQPLNLNPDPFAVAVQADIDAMDASLGFDTPKP